MKNLLKLVPFFLIFCVFFVNCSSNKKAVGETSVEPNPDEGIIIFLTDIKTTAVTTVGGFLKPSFNEINRPAGAYIASDNYYIYETENGITKIPSYSSIIENEKKDPFLKYKMDLIRHGVPRIGEDTLVAYRFPVSNKEQEFYFMNQYNYVWGSENLLLRFLKLDKDIFYIVNQNTVTIPIIAGQQFYLVTRDLSVRKLEDDEIEEYLSTRKYTNNGYNKNFGEYSLQPGLIVSTTQQDVSEFLYRKDLSKE